MVVRVGKVQPTKDDTLTEFGEVAGEGEILEQLAAAAETVLEGLHDDVDDAETTGEVAPAGPVVAKQAPRARKQKEKGMFKGWLAFIVCANYPNLMEIWKDLLPGKGARAEVSSSSSSSSTSSSSSSSSPSETDRQGSQQPPLTPGAIAALNPSSAPMVTPASARRARDEVIANMASSMSTFHGTLSESLRRMEGATQATVEQGERLWLRTERDQRLAHLEKAITTFTSDLASAEDEGLTETEVASLQESLRRAKRQRRSLYQAEVEQDEGKEN